MAEALLFAAAEPLDKATLEDRLPEGVDVDGIMDALVEEYAGRGVNVCKAAGKWSLRTAPDLAFLMEKERTDPKKLSRPALETLAIIGYHQPVTRAEIEEIRGVSVSKGTIDLLMEIGWVRLRGRRRAPGKPVTYGTTDDFLEHFGLEQVGDLPGMDELKAAGLLDARLPPGFEVPVPTAAGDDEEADDDETPEEAPEFAQDFLEEAGEASAGADSIDDEADDEIETTDE
ncbi:MAG: SMC-Scp complex subunit ScpB [Pseudomonadota bacterium]